MERILNYINGVLAAPQADEWLPVYEPATGKVYAQVPNSSAIDVDAAQQSAAKAFEHWKHLGQEKRSAYLNKIATLLHRDATLLAEAESRDNGKPVSLAAKMDIPRAAQNFEFFASAVIHFASESHYTEPVALNYTLRQPIGVVGCISPWNLPLYLFTWKIAPALAVGNTVVAKASEITPYTAFLLSKLCIEAELPPGVLNIVHGLGNTAGNAIVAHPDISVISFTGGTTTGRNIAAIAAPMFKKLSLELGGKNPVMIFDDADLEQAVATTVRSSFTNQGQICLCGSRIFVHKNIYDVFMEKFIAKVNQLKVGDPTQNDSNLGAVVSAPHMEKVLGYIEKARLQGGKIATGGQQVHLTGRCENGWFIAPTVITALDYRCDVNQEEIFGPVVTVTPFDTEEEVLTMANSTGYGLAAVLWTNDLKKAHRVAERTKSGIIWINCWLLRDLRTPFGGMKQSGVGREGGWEALRFFTEPKNVCVAL